MEDDRNRENVLKFKKKNHFKESCLHPKLQLRARIGQDVGERRKKK